MYVLHVIKASTAHRLETLLGAWLDHPEGEIVSVGYVTDAEEDGQTHRAFIIYKA